MTAWAAVSSSLAFYATSNHFAFYLAWMCTFVGHQKMKEIHYKKCNHKALEDGKSLGSILSWQSVAIIPLKFLNSWQLKGLQGISPSLDQALTLLLLFHGRKHFTWLALFIYCFQYSWNTILYHHNLCGLPVLASFCDIMNKKFISFFKWKPWRFGFLDLLRPLLVGQCQINNWLFWI